MFGLGATELLVIVGLIVIIFGAKRLPDIGRAIGRAKSEFSQANDSSKGQAEGKADGQADDSGLETAIKDQLVSRLPGFSQVDRLKRTAEKAQKVAQMVDGGQAKNTPGAEPGKASPSEGKSSS